MVRMLAGWASFSCRVLVSRRGTNGLAPVEDGPFPLENRMLAGLFETGTELGLIGTNEVDCMGRVASVIEPVEHLP